MNNKVFTVSLKSVTLIVFSLLLSSCVEEIKEENFYTFTGEMISDYLDNRSETFSSFSYVLQRAGVKQLLAAYGEYTCFAPTNEAFDIYLREKGYADITQLTDADCDTIAFGHVIKVAYLTTDLDNGVVGTANMNARFIQVYIDSITSDYYVNRDSRIILKDQEVENGVVQVVDRVLLPSTEQLPDLIEADEKCSLFSAALRLTHLDDSLQRYMDETYVYDESIYDYTRQGEKCPKPKHRRFGYTAFVETDEAFRAAGITTLDELIAYAQTVYGASFPEEKGRFDSDYTHRRNPLNRFVAYHLLARTIYASKMTTTTSIMPQYESVDYYETMCPGTIIRVEKGQGTRYKGLRINRRWDKQFTIEGVLVHDESGFDGNNGVYYYIDRPLVFDTDVRDKVLNVRMRFDAASLMPELSTNGIYRNDERLCYWIPDGYSENMKFFQESIVIYQYPQPDYWCWYGDEIIGFGLYDFALKLPPVPEGTYEIRYGYVPMAQRGITQIYVDDIPQGIPIDLTVNTYGTPSSPKIGWIADTGDEEEDNKNDKAMHNRGYLKGPDSQCFTSARTLARSQQNLLRKIVATQYLTPDEPHYIRFRSVTQNSLEFMLDYIELCPKSVYDNPIQREDRH